MPVSVVSPEQMCLQQLFDLSEACRIVVVQSTMCSIGVVQQLWNTDHRTCCASAVTDERSQRMHSSTRYKHPCNAGRPGQWPWIGLVVAQATCAVVAESAWCDHGAAQQLQMARWRSGQIMRDASSVLYTRHVRQAQPDARTRSELHSVTSFSGARFSKKS